VLRADVVAAERAGLHPAAAGRQGHHRGLIIIVADSPLVDGVPGATANSIQRQQCGVDKRGSSAATHVQLGSSVSSSVPWNPSAPTQPLAQSGSTASPRTSQRNMLSSLPWQARKPATIGRVGSCDVCPYVYSSPSW